MSILEKTMNEMPNGFTSNEFNKKAVQNGYSKELLERKGLSRFIKIYADNAYPGSKTWIKKPKKHTNNSESNLENNGLNDLQSAILMVKKAGLKVMKPVNDWVEV